MMKKLSLLLSLYGMSILTVASAQNIKQWKPEQLLPPDSLAGIIVTPSTLKPLIINIGPSGSIKGSIEVGPVGKSKNLNTLRELLLKEDKDRKIVIYCGCCPYKNCPNINPALSLLTTLKFTNYKLLDLPHNLKVDWIDHGYPMAK